jgi:serine/threonine protein kinase
MNTHSRAQASLDPLYNTPGAPAVTSPRLPLIPHATLRPRSLGPSGAFGELEFVEWKGIVVAAKRNGTDCVDTAAIDNERRLYEKLKDNPHDHILPVYGICTDAPDGKVRLVMKYCEKGSLDALLRHHAAPEVGPCALFWSSNDFHARLQCVMFICPSCAQCFACGVVCVAVLDAVCCQRGVLNGLPPPPSPPTRTLTSCFAAQGGLTLTRVLTLLKQVLAALLHLHSLGILHRDLRAANVLVSALDPLHAMVADFGVSHLLSAFSGGAGAGAGRAADLTAGKVHTVLRGGAALGPLQVCASHTGPPLSLSSMCALSLCFRSFAVVCPPACSFCCPWWSVAVQWSAPEVCAGSAEAGTVATTASDVYMVGGLLYELLTGGTPPFHWLATDLESSLLLGRRRATADRVPIPGLRSGLTGLLGKSVLEVAEEDGEPIPWCVRVDGSPGSAGRLEALKALLAQCLAGDPGARPKVRALLATVDDLLVAEIGEVRATWVPPVRGGGGGSGSSSSGSAGVPTFPSTCMAVPRSLPVLMPTPPCPGARTLLSPVVAAGCPPYAPLSFRPSACKPLHPQYGQLLVYYAHRWGWRQRQLLQARRRPGRLAGPARVRRPAGRCGPCVGGHPPGACAPPASRPPRGWSARQGCAAGGGQTGEWGAGGQLWHFGEVVVLPPVGFHRWALCAVCALEGGGSGAGDGPREGSGRGGSAQGGCGC